MMGALALTFSACSSEDDLANVNPTYDGNAVKTQFAINVGTGNFVTRATAANVQAGTNPTFLGLDNMMLFAFNGEPAAASATTTQFALGSIGKTITADNSNKFYTLQIPVGTNNFVFYGEAPEGTKADKGVLTNNVSTATTLGEIQFALNKRATDAFTSTGAEIAGKLTAIAAATGWKDAESQILKDLYTNFTTTEDKIRAGYGEAVKRMVNDLKEAATMLSNSNPDGSELKTVADNILAAITANPVDSYSEFPGEDMPAGAAQLECTNGTFSYKTMADVFKTTNADPQKIAYPAELVYWDNSDLRETANEKTEADYPNGVTNWADNDNAKWKDWTIGAVKANTRAIAMKRNINYGVAGLHSTVSWTAGNYADNRKALVDPTNGEDETFAVTSESFTLTGILVGGQPEAAKWDLLPKANTFDWVVYDNKLNATNDCYTLLLDNYNTGETQSDVLVALEFTNNLKHTVTKADGNTEVVAADFYGVDGIIPAGGKFYLVGKLELRTAANWTENYENNRINTTKRIFAQDRMTEASFKFSANALKNAYETIPDLQSVAMLFGLSVDIKWLPGLIFTNVPL